MGGARRGISGEQSAEGRTEWRSVLRGGYEVEQCLAALPPTPPSSQPATLRGARAAAMRGASHLPHKLPVVGLDAVAAVALSRKAREISVRVLGRDTRGLLQDLVGAAQALERGGGPLAVVGVLVRVPDCGVEGVVGKLGCGGVVVRRGRGRWERGRGEGWEWVGEWGCTSGGRPSCTLP